MSVLEELKKKIADIETQSLAMDGCRPTFTVSEIMDLIDSVESDKQKAESAQNVPNGDYISRRAAIDLVKFECGEWTGLAKTIGNRINEMPSAQPEQKWTPCSDPSDLPKDDRLWITREIYGARIVYDVVWDMTEWSDDVSGVVAYMPYWEPEPYVEGWKE